jgi:protein-tyrosine phosphatase
MSQITDAIYIGDIYDATDIEFLILYKIKYVFNLCTYKYDVLGKEEFPNISYLYFPIEDDDNADILSICEPIKSLIDKCNDGNILIHCTAGLSRSPSVIIYYLIKTLTLTFDEAFEYMIKKRPKIDINYGFVKQLKSI